MGISAFFAAMMAKQWVAFILRNWKWIVGGLTVAALVAYIGWLNFWMDHYKRQLGEAGEAVATAVRVNGDMARAMDRMEAARLASEQALGRRIARKSKEADRLAALVQYVMAQEKSNACAASPSIRAVLDSLRQSPGSDESPAR